MKIINKHITNLAQMISCRNNTVRLHEWDEENRLRFVFGDRHVGFYGYDANGERIFKLTGTGNNGQINSGHVAAQTVFDDAVLYPNPYIVITPRGYTKHYFAGSERLATVIGSGGFDLMTTSMDHQFDSHDNLLLNVFNSHYGYNHSDPFHYNNLPGIPLAIEDIEGEQYPELNYCDEPVALDYMDILASQDILYQTISSNATWHGQETTAFFYHGDHLGSANWITDVHAQPVQYLHYAPYGEIIENQMSYGYNERYKFTGKERDRETGYDFYGARFYWSAIGHWLSVDPLVDERLNTSPYLFCSGNPIVNKDPNGMIDWSVVKSGSITTVTGVGTAIAGVSIAGGTSGLAAPIGGLLIMDGISATGIGVSLLLYGLMTDPSEKNTQLLNSIPMSATNALSKSADIIAGTEHHEIENSVDGLMIVASGKPKWKTSSEKFVSITTALESVSLISKVAGENESKGIKNCSPYTEIVQRQDNTRCPVAEKPQPLELDNNNL